MKSTRKKILFSTGGLVIALLILEISLRFTGFLYKIYRVDKNISATQDMNTIKILCLGDSFTFGVGVQKGYSYPEQLEKMLNQNSQQHFIVYNAGVPGSNSSYIAKHLEANIKKYNPDIILLLTGRNNNSNFADSNYFLFLDKNPKTYLYRADAFLSHLKIYKLLKMIFLQLADKVDFMKSENRVIAQEIKNNAGISSCNKKVIMKVDSQSSEEAKVHLELARQYEKEYKFKLALLEAKRSIELNPYDSQAHALLGFIQVHQIVDLQSAIVSLKKAIELDPCNMSAIESLFNAYHRTGNLELAREALQQLNYLNPQNEYYRHLLAYGIPHYKDLRLFELMLGYDLKNIYTVARSKNILLILLGYVSVAWPNRMIKEFAHLYKLPFVDNETAFEKVQRKEDCFAEDGHYNEKGYRILSLNVRDLIQSRMVWLK